MNLKICISVACAGALLAGPASAFADEQVTAECSLRADGSAIDASAVSTLNTVTAPIVDTAVVCVAYDAVTGEKLARAGRALWGTRVYVSAPVSVPAGHGVRLGLFGRADYMDGTNATTGEYQD